MLGIISDLKVRTKIFGLTAFVAVLLVAFALISLDTLNTVKIKGPLYQQIIENKDLVADVLPPPGYLVEAYLVTLQILDEREKPKLDALIQRSVQLREEYAISHQHWEKTLADGELRDAMIVRSYRPAIRFLDLRDKVLIPSVLKGDLKTAREIAQGELKQSYEEHREGIDKVVMMASQKTDADEKTAQSIIHRRMTMQLALACLVAGIGLVTAYLLSRYITTSVNECLAFAGQVARGDLTVRLHPKSNDELGALGGHFNEMVSSLSEMAGRIRTSTQEITAATGQILATVSQHTASANEGSAAVNQTTATVEEARASAEQSAQQAEDVSHLAQAALNVSQEGIRAVQAIVTGMEDVRHQVHEIAGNILTLSQRAQQIEEITSTVEDIAAQSNLLAVNAAIEARKAGEHGKGFSVVAGEVRALAEQSRQATGKVRTMLHEIQRATHAAVMATEQGTRGVEAGLTVTQRAGQIIEELERAIQDSAGAARQIVASMDQQRQAMREIGLAMQGINQATAQSLAGSRQSQQAVESLNTQARELQSFTERYKLGS